MRVLFKEPSKEAISMDIEDDYKVIQKYVGNPFQAIYPFEGQFAILCDDEGRLKGLDSNIALVMHGKVYDIIAGPLMIVGLDKEDFISLSNKEFKLFQEAINRLQSQCIIGQAGGRKRIIPAINVDKF